MGNYVWVTTFGSLRLATFGRLGVWLRLGQILFTVFATVDLPLLSTGCEKKPNGSGLFNAIVKHVHEVNAARRTEVDSSIEGRAEQAATVWLPTNR